MKTRYFVFTRAFVAIAAGLAFGGHAALALSVPVTDDISSNAKSELTVAAGRAPVLPVSAKSDAFVRFDIDGLPDVLLPADILSARLRIYTPAVKIPGDITVHLVTATWSEGAAGAAPTFDATPVATIPAAVLGKKEFAEVDVTATVKAWLAGTTPNNGLALSSADGVVTVSAKEGSSSGYPAELEILSDVPFLGGVITLPLDLPADGLRVGGSQFVVSNSGRIGIGTSSPQFQLDLRGDANINNSDLFLRAGDINHGLGWYGNAGANKPFAGVDVDGPVLFGFGGGALGSTQAGSKIAMRWLSNGNVGIGTATPAAPLDIDTGVGQLQVRNDSGVSPSINLTGGPNPGRMRLRNAVEIWPNDAGTASGYLDLRDAAGAAKIALDGGGGSMFLLGKLAIGRTDASAPLDINTGVGRLLVRNDAGLAPGITLMDGPNPGLLRVRNAVEIWPNDAGTAPGSLDVRAKSGAATVKLDGQAGTIFVDASGQGSGGIVFGGLSSGEAIFSNRGAAAPNQFGLDLYTNATPRLSVTIGGDVGIGNNTPLGKLEIQAGADADGSNDGKAIAFAYRTGGFRHWIRTRHNASSRASNAIDFFVNTGNTAGASSAPNVNNKLVMTMNGDGLVGIGRTPQANLLEVGGEASKNTAGAWLANSDRRIKTEIENVTDAVATLDRVRLVSFRYTADYRATHPGIADTRYLNVIAQEFREVFPDHVKASGEKFSDGSDVLQVDTYPLTIYTAAAVQELHRELNAKNAELQALAERGAAIEQRLLALETQARACEAAPGNPEQR